MKTIIQNLLTVLAIFAGINHVAAQGTAFAYQGRLNDGTNPATGIYDLRFTIYDAATGGAAHGALTNAATGITNGLFTATLDFGGVFNGANYWLELAARTNGGGAFSPLSPRQPVLPTPYAIYAANAGNASSVAAANIVGIVPLAQLPAAVVTNNETGANLTGTFTGNGGGLTNLPAASLTGTVADSLLSSNIARLNIPNTTVQATATPLVTAGFITGTANLNGGSGYTNNPSVTVTDVSGSNAVITATISNGVVTSLAVQNAGSHYSAAATLTIALPPSNAYQTFNSGNVFNGVSTFNNASGNFAGLFTGNGAGLTNMNLTGPSALSALSNSASGFQALASDTTGYDNTANGYDSLQNNTTGVQNTANGEQTLQYNTSGSWNTAVGYEALGTNTTGYYNSAFGYVALRYNTIGFYNTASGVNALGNNTSGNSNTGDGVGALQSNTTGSYNTANGRDALGYNTTGNYNAANGSAALRNNTIASYNTAGGYQALFSNMTGNYNIAEGYQAGYNITTGSSNIDIGNMGLASDTNIIRIGSGQAQAFIAGVITGNGGGLTNVNLTGPSANSALANEANGYQALQSNMTGGNNTANGYRALNSNTNGNWNTANGYEALQQNTSGSQNTANGSLALISNTTGSDNVANGMSALISNTTGTWNTANGVDALHNNTTGFENTSDGNAALGANINGNNNTANGFQALFSNTNGSYSVADGSMALWNSTTGSNNIALGYQAGYNLTTGSSNIDIGNMGLATDTNIIRIGSGQTQAFIAGVITGNGGGLTNLNASQLTSGSFTAATLTLTGNLNLPATIDTIYSGSSTLLRSDGNGNFFAGSGAGNLSLSSPFNTGIGWEALSFVTTGSQNTAIGASALRANTTGTQNTANGSGALGQNTSGSFNVVNGFNALNYNTSGNYNTANGFQALIGNTSGSDNVADGANALFNNTTGGNNIALGYQTGWNITTGSSNIDIGNMGLVTDTNIIRIGSGQTQAFIAGQIVGDGSGLTNLNVGQLPSAVLTNNASGVNLAGTFSGDGSGLYNTITTANYVSAYDTANHLNSTANTFQSVSFGAASLSGWTYIGGGAATFTCPQSGMYLVQYTAEAATTINSATTISLRVFNLATSFETPGSESSVVLSVANQATPVSKSFLAYYAVGNAIQIQFTGSNTSAELIGGIGASTYQPSISCTIIRIQ